MIDKIIDEIYKLRELHKHYNSHCDSLICNCGIIKNRVITVGSLLRLDIDILKTIYLTKKPMQAYLFTLLAYKYPVKFKKFKEKYPSAILEKAEKEKKLIDLAIKKEPTLQKFLNAELLWTRKMENLDVEGINTSIYLGSEIYHTLKKMGIKMGFLPVVKRYKNKNCQQKYRMRITKIKDYLVFQHLNGRTSNIDNLIEKWLVDKGR